MSMDIPETDSVGKYFVFPILQHFDSYDYDAIKICDECIETDPCCHEISFFYTSIKYYIYLRNSSCQSITRLEMVQLTIGEKWYLRLLLYNIPAFSFKDIKTINGITYSSYQLAAVAAKLVEDENEALIAFEWALNFSTAAELRSLFVIMTTQGFPTASIFQNVDMRKNLWRIFCIK